MALEAILTRTGVTDDGSQTYWRDDTVYGAPNLNRNQVAVFLTAYKVDIDQVESPLVVQGFDPEIATEFITENSLDGWYKYYFAIVENWLIGTTYSRYDLVWDTVTELFYEYVNATPTAGNAVTDTTYFAPVSDPTSKIANVGTATESGNLIYAIVQKIFDYATAACYVTLATRIAKDNCGGDCGDGCDGCNSRESKLFKKIRSLLTSMRLDEAQELWFAGERAARLAEKYCDDCGCSNN